MEKLFKVDSILAEKGINFFQVYKDTGIKYESIKKLCDNTGAVTINTLLKLADYLSVNVVDLFADNQSYSQTKYFNLGYQQAIDDLNKLKKGL